MKRLNEEVWNAIEWLCAGEEIFLKVGMISLLKYQLGQSELQCSSAEAILVNLCSEKKIVLKLYY